MKTGGFFGDPAKHVGANAAMCEGYKPGRLGRERDGTDGVQFGIYMVHILNLALLEALDSIYPADSLYFFGLTLFI